MPYDGHAWYRSVISIPAAWRDGEVHLVMGTVDDTDRTYLDGRLIGMTDGKTPKHWDALRDYPLPPGQIRFGERQTVAIHVFDQQGDGGLRKLPVRLEVRPRDSAGASPYVPWRPRYDPDAYHNW
jgi:sialate O-acetylesterase